MSVSVHIHHIATGDSAVIVRRCRIDVPAAEPYTLIAEDRLMPGDSVHVRMAAGETVTLHEESPHVR